MRNMPKLRWLALTGVALLSAGMFTPAHAQADPDDGQRGVARINLMDGEVSVRRGDSGDWVAGVLNAPLMAGDSVATSPTARAEVQFDASNTLRIGGDSEVRLTVLEYGRYQLEIARGTVTYRVLRQTDAEVEVDTPNISIKPLKIGAYRITVSDAGETEVTARSGAVEVFTPTGSQWVNAGQTMQARGAASSPEFRFAATLARDDWDRWNDTRDHAELDTPSYGYVPPGVYGVEDLDRYGNWVYQGDYGYCWEPLVSVGWSPYSLGRWSWLDWYGWSWVSYDPWGWAPYHYGRWFNRANNWYWYPGSPFTRHYWSPGLVSFFGWGGGGGGFGFGFGNIGWVPLAPNEAFHPWWGSRFYGHQDYIRRNINITSVNITRQYANARVAGGITGLRRIDFEGGRFRDLTHYSGAQIGTAGVVQGAIPIAPGSGNLRFSDRQSTVAPRAVPNVRFASRQPATAVNRIPFAEQQRGFEQAGMLNRSGNAGSPGPAAAAAPAAPGAVRQAGPAPQQAQPGGWRQAGEGGSRDVVARPTPNGAAQVQAPSQAPAAGEPSGQSSRGGWERFGTPGGMAPAASRAPGNQQTAPQPAPQAQQPDRSGWNRFGSPGTAPRQQASPQPASPAPSYGNRDNAPRYSAPSAPRQSAPQYSAPPQQSAPQYNAPPRQSAPQYSAPPAPRQSAPSYNAPPAPRQSEPARSAPPSNSGGGGSSAPRNSGGNDGGARPSGGGGGRR